VADGDALLSRRAVHLTLSLSVCVRAGGKALLSLLQVSTVLWWLAGAGAVCGARPSWLAGCCTSFVQDAGGPLRGAVVLERSRRPKQYQIRRNPACTAREVPSEGLFVQRGLEGGLEGRRGRGGGNDRTLLLMPAGGPHLFGRAGIPIKSAMLISTEAGRDSSRRRRGS
jgi:hypothetical protein